MKQLYEEQPTTLLENVEATGIGESVYLGEAYESFIVSVVFTNSGGSVTVLVIALEGSIDGVTWGILASHTLTAEELVAQQALFSSSDAPVKYIRANITTLTETGTTAVTIKALANKG